MSRSSQPKPTAKGATPPIPDLEDLREQNLAELESSAIEKVRAAFGEGDGENKWLCRVTRVVQSNSKGIREPWLFDCEVDDLEGVRARLSSEYGNGFYRCRVRLNGKAFSQYDIEIELSPKQNMEFLRSASLVPATLAAATPVAPAGPGGDNIFTAMMQMMERQSAETRALIESLANREKPADPLDSFTKIATAFQSYQNLGPKQEASTGMEMFKQGMEFAEKIQGAAESGNRSLLMTLAEKAMETGILDKLIALATPQQPAPAAPQLPRVEARPHPGPQNFAPPPFSPAMQPAPASRPGGTHQPAPAAMPAQPAAAPANDDTKAAIDFLVSQAMQGANPALFADETLARMPPALIAALEVQPDIFSFLAQRYPQMAPHEAWFNRLIDLMFDAAQDAHAGQGDGDAKPSAA